jgi:hypothetical protein
LLATRVVQTFEKVGYREIQPCEELLMAELKITRIVLNIRKFALFWSIVILLIKIATPSISTSLLFFIQNTCITLQTCQAILFQQRLYIPVQQEF